MTALALKLIATITMVIDHFGIIFSDLIPPAYFRMIGRISFPLFAFLTAESARHTSNIKKYLLRLFILASIVEMAYRAIPFILGEEMIMLADPIINIVFSLFLAVLAIYCYQEFQKKQNPLFLLGIAVIVFLFYQFPFDYGLFGLSLIFIFYFFRNSPIALVLASIAILVDRIPNISHYLSGGRYFHALVYVACSFLPILLIGLYNGKKGRKTNKYIFYAIYPGQYVVLYLLHAIVGLFLA